MSRRSAAAFLVVSLAMTLPVVAAQEESSKDAAPRRTRPWPAEVVALAKRLPVQDQGRVKPLSTFASFLLLELHGRRTMRVETPEGRLEKLSPTEWLLDCLFFPNQARSYPLFRVEDYEATTAVGLPHEGKRKRDDWSYDELAPAWDRLAALGRKWSELDERDRTRLQSQVVRLASDFFSFHQLLDRWEGLAIFPPPAGEEKWLTPAELAQRAAHGDSGLEAQERELRRIGELFDARTDLSKFAALFRDWQSALVGMASERGEYDKIPLEVRYYEADFFFWAQVLFVLSFLVSAIAVIWMRSRLLGTFARLLLGVPLVPLVAGITVRCILRERPPVSTLYETILFVTAVACLAAWITEWITRRWVALLLGGVLGAAGMFFASWYEEVSAVDTMPKLQAVLDTNFWLSTHVTTISIGYSAALLAAAVAHVYLGARLLDRPRGDGGAFLRHTARTLYGILAFALVFSTVGTILGGIWANESWGRFWGWDPKENGALMICLVTLVILHARVGGYLRDFGVALSSILLGTVVAFSWFHVNLLGVGLHSYGFDKRLHSLVWGFYSVEWTVFAVGWLSWAQGALRKRAQRRAAGAVTTATT